MSIELIVLALGAILLLVHILLAGHFTTQQFGRRWNMGARDEDLPPLNPLAGRLVRARDNFQEKRCLSPLLRCSAWFWRAKHRK
jgi:uncharacterized MAPEG superfamily protein